MVWTTDTSRLGVRPLTSWALESAMPDSDDQRDDQMLELESLRLASDLRQLAKQTLDPDLKAHCLRMAKEWSDDGDEPGQDDTAGQ